MASNNSKPLKARISGPGPLDSIQFNVIGKAPSLLSRLNEVTPQLQEDDEDLLPMDIDEESSNETVGKPSLLQRIAALRSGTVDGERDATDAPHSFSHLPLLDQTHVFVRPQNIALPSATGSVAHSQGDITANSSLPSPPLSASMSMDMSNAGGESTTSLNQARAEAPTASIAPNPPQPISISSGAIAVVDTDRQRRESEFIKGNLEKAILDLITEEKSAWEDVWSTRDDEQHRQELLKWHRTHQISLPPTPGLQDEAPSSIPSPLDDTAATPMIVDNLDGTSTSTTLPEKLSSSVSERSAEERNNKPTPSLPALSGAAVSTSGSLAAEKEIVCEELESVENLAPSHVSESPSAKEANATQEAYESDNAGRTYLSVQPASPVDSPANAASSTVRANSVPIADLQMFRQASCMGTEEKESEHIAIAQVCSLPLGSQARGNDGDEMPNSIPYPTSLSAHVESNSHEDDSAESPSPIEREFQFRERTVSDNDAAGRPSASGPTFDAISSSSRSLTTFGSVMSVTPDRDNPASPSISNFAPANGAPPMQLPNTQIPRGAASSATNSAMAVQETGPQPTLASLNTHQSQLPSSLKRKRSESAWLNLKLEPTEEKLVVTGDSAATLNGRAFKKKKEETPPVSFTKEELEEQKCRVSPIASGGPVASSFNEESAQSHSSVPPVSNNEDIVGLDTTQTVGNSLRHVSLDSMGAEHPDGHLSRNTSNSNAPPENRDAAQQPDMRDRNMITAVTEPERALSMESSDSSQHDTFERAIHTQMAERPHNNSDNGGRSPRSSYSRSPRTRKRSLDHWPPKPDRHVAIRLMAHDEFHENSRLRRVEGRDRDLLRRSISEREPPRLTDTYRPNYAQQGEDSYRARHANHRESNAFRDTEPLPEVRSPHRDMRYPRAVPQYESERSMNRRDEPPQPRYWQSRAQAFKSPSPPGCDNQPRRFRDNMDSDGHRAGYHEQHSEPCYPALGRCMTPEPPATPRRTFYNESAPSLRAEPLRPPPYPRSPSPGDYFADERIRGTGAHDGNYYKDNGQGTPFGIGQYRSNGHPHIVPITGTPARRRTDDDEIFIDSPSTRQESHESHLQREYHHDAQAELDLIKPHGSSTPLPLAERLGGTVKARTYVITSTEISEHPRGPRSKETGEGAGPSKAPKRTEAGNPRGRGHTKKGLAERLQDPRQQPIGRGRGGSVGVHGRTPLNDVRTSGPSTRGMPRSNAPRSTRPIPPKGNPLSLEERIQSG